MTDCEYDYIIIGAGSSGCVVAGELGADPACRVLVLEAGPAAEDNPETLAAPRYKEAFINEALMWDRVSEPQPGCGGNRLFLGSGRGSGGSGSINAMVYTRGDRLDYAQWRCPGWTWDELAPDFAAVEQRLQISRPPATRFTKTCASGDWVVDFLRDGSGELYFVLAEVELPRGVTAPSSIAEEIAPHVLHVVERSDSRFTNKRLTDIVYASALYDEISKS